jgi:cytochrome c peroxidase
VVLPIEQQIAVSATYMHDGRFASPRDVIDHNSTDTQTKP